ncbi:unnamed protein product [Rhodiola kirilowii]
MQSSSHHHWRLLRRFSSWSSAIRDAASSSPINALRLFSEMHSQAVAVDSFSLLYTLKSSAAIKDHTLISNLHAHATKIGFDSHLYVGTSLLNAYAVTDFRDACQLFDEMPERNTVTWNTMISGHAKSGDLIEACLLFEKMPEKGVGSWSALIAGCINNGKLKEGLGVFREMIGNEGIIPSQSILVSVLAGCARMGFLGLLTGKSVHAFITKNGLELNVELGSVLVDMYAKCGLVDSATKVADLMRERNVTTWTSLICGLAQHGRGQEAVSLFKKMEQEANIHPNEMTFTGVLSACAQAGMVQEGQKYFDLLEKNGMQIKIQHYGCMVDLYGKAGQLKNAYQVIKQMKIVPNNVVWGTFLTACKMHKQFEFAEKVVDQVLTTVTPENDGGVYSLLCDLYAMNEKWDDAERVRKLMVNQNVRKARGSSFI